MKNYNIELKKENDEGLEGKFKNSLDPQVFGKFNDRRQETSLRMHHKYLTNENSPCRSIFTRSILMRPTLGRSRFQAYPLNQGPPATCGFLFLELIVLGV